MDLSGFGTLLMVIVGPLLLALVIAWAVLRNRQSRTARGVTEAGTRRLYAQEDRRRRSGTDDEKR
jgi:hypothetical protein